MKKLFAVAAVLLCANIAVAQSKKEKKEERKEDRKEKINALISQEEEGVLIYNKQTVYGLQLRSNGYGAFVEVGRMIDRNKTNIFQIEFSETMHPKEDKFQFGDGFNSSTPFKLGKQNYFYNLRYGMGQSRRIGDKGNKNGVSVQAIYLGGITLGLERPYYVDVLVNYNTANQEIKTIKYEKDNPDNNDLFINYAIAGAGLAKGWGEIKLNPGAYAKTGIRFDYGRYNELVSAIEVGVSLDFYAKKVPQMVLNKEKQLFMAAYMAIEFGKRK